LGVLDFVDVSLPASLIGQVINLDQFGKNEHYACACVRALTYVCTYTCLLVHGNEGTQTAVNYDVDGSRFNCGCNYIATEPEVETV